MADPEKALATQLKNIEKRTGKSLDELAKIVRNSGLSKHGELVTMLKNDIGMGHGDANTLVHTVRKTAGRTYVSYRRKKQFATIGPATKTSGELGLYMKGVKATERLEELPPGRMCNYRVRLSEAKEVDPELISWIRTAYEAAG